MRAWSEADQVAADYDIDQERSRCGGCGTLPDDARWVEAVVNHCPVCEDVHRKAKRMKREHGERVGLDVITDPTEAALYSSRARYTLEGARERAAVKAETRKVE